MCGPHQWIPKSMVQGHANDKQIFLQISATPAMWLFHCCGSSAGGKPIPGPFSLYGFVSCFPFTALSAVFIGIATVRLLESKPQQ